MSVLLPTCQYYCRKRLFLSVFDITIALYPQHMLRYDAAQFVHSFTKKKKNNLRKGFFSI